MKLIYVLLVDDEPEVLRGLRMRLGLEDDICVIGEAVDGANAVELASILAPDVVVMDVNLPVVDGISATRQITTRAPQSSVVILSMQDDQHTIKQALAAGATAFVAKQQPDRDLLRAIRGAGRKGGTLGKQRGEEASSTNSEANRQIFWIKRRQS
jgi:DNA-binding NarL/FixJ family response regulator